MKDKLFEKPIVVLPKDHKDVRMVKMQPSELLLNAAFEVRLRELRGDHFADNDPRKKLCCLMAQLTRLRQ
jgi:hypothetical protein